MNLEIGKLPPQSIELEEAVIGALLIDGKAIFDVIDLLKPEHFYKDSLKAIYSAILAIYTRNEGIDVLTVSNELKTAKELEKIGGHLALAQLTNKVASSAHINNHAHIIVQNYLKRQIIQVSTELIKDAYEDSGDAFELINTAEVFIGELSNSLRKSVNRKIGTLITEYYKELYSSEKVKGVKSGFVELDQITGGWQKSDLIILAARPGMGKTAIALNFAETAGILNDKRVLFFSLEMSAIQLTQRLVSSQTEVYLNSLKHKRLTDMDYHSLQTKIDAAIKSSIYINDTGYCDISFIKSTSRRLHQENNLDLIVVDYLQLIKGGTTYKGNREQEISEISRNLKALAKELDLPIIVLSQLSREVEKRGDKRPQLSDLRESGAIEQDADIVLFLMRPEYYSIAQINLGGEDLPTKGLAIVDVAKHRNGSTGQVIVKSKLEISKFEDLMP